MKRNCFGERHARKSHCQPLRGFGTIALATLAWLACSANARADEGISSRMAEDSWKFSISPYLWATGIEGTVRTLPDLPASEIDQSFSDILDDLQFSGMLFYTARKGRFGIAGDIEYVHTLAKDNALAPLYSREELDSKMFALSVLGEYLVYDNGRTNLSIAGGARLWSIDTDLKLSTGLLPGRTHKGDQTWVDPVIGVNGVFPIGEKVFVRGWGLVGGFGVSSDFFVDLFAGVGYSFTDSTSATLGYRWMKVDYDRNDFLYDVRQQGVAAGITFAF